MFMSSSERQNIELPIKFDAQRVAMIAALCDESADTVTSVLWALNDLLLGDPIGTVRRSSDGQAMAVRRLEHGDTNHYDVTFLGKSGGMDHSRIYNWPIVYRPDEEENAP